MLRRSLRVMPLAATSAPVVAALELGAVRRMFSPAPESERESTCGGSPSSGSSLSRIWSSSVPTPFRMSLVPLHSTRQDKALIDIVTGCYYTDPRSASVVHAHRGARKSYVAQRCAQRSKLFFFNPFVVGITYIDASEMEAATLDNTIAAEFSYLAYVIDFGVTAIFAVAVAVVWALARSAARWWNNKRNDETSSGEPEETMLKMIPRMVWEELPTDAMFLVFVAGVIIRLVKRRCRVFIFDNPGGVTLAEARYLLDRLDGKAHAVPMVILTSNDGIGMCFTDKNRSVRAYLSFPPPKVEELPDVLRDVAVTRSMPLLQSIDVATVAAATQYNLEHHALSVTWWIGLAYHAVLRVKHLDAATIERLSRDRSFLWHTVLFLDCAAEPVFRPECLGFSKPLTDEQKMTVAKLVLPLDATDEQLQELVKRLPAKCPRRLALAWALVLTAKSGDVEHVQHLRRKLTTEIPKKEGRDSQAYQNFLQPLVKAIDEFMAQQTAKDQPTRDLRTASTGRPANPYERILEQLVKVFADFMAQQIAARSANTASSPNENEKAVNPSTETQKAENTKQSPTTRRRKSPKK